MNLNDFRYNVLFVGLFISIILFGMVVDSLGKRIEKVSNDLKSHEISHPLFFQISEKVCTRCGSNVMVGSMLRDCESASFFCGSCGYRFADMKSHKFYCGPDRNEIFLKETKK